MLLIRATRPARPADDDRTDGSGADQSDGARTSVREVAAHVLERLSYGPTTTTAQESVALLLRRSLVATNDTVRYDSTTGELYADEGEVRVRIERPPAPWLSWFGYYTAVAVVAFAAIAAQWVGAYTLSPTATTALLAGAFVLVLCGAAYQRHARIDVPLDPRGPSE